jgi:predicted RNA-binding protein with RPS1 domain
MSEYCWPEGSHQSAARARHHWAATIAALPAGMHVTGEVIGRQPFGVFVRIDGVPDAVGLAEITSMPRDAELPAVSTHVVGDVIDHVEHNHQVRIRLTRW